MTKSKVSIVGGILLVYFAILEGAAADQNVKADFIENVKESPGASRIVSGWESYSGQHPHQLALRTVSAVGVVSGCAGVLVHGEWALTAAHCTARQQTIVIRAGVTNMSTPEHISESTVYYIHPEYDLNRPATEVQSNDVALVQILRPVAYTTRARPIRVQSRAEALRDYDGQIAYTSGFGRTWTDGPSAEVLQWVYLTLISNTECSRTFGDLIEPSHICAGPYNVTSQSVCRGDSGGPLVHISDDGLPTLIGVTSFVIGGEYGCHSGYPGAFVRPGAYLDWFYEITGIDFEDLEAVEETTLPPTTTEVVTVSTQPPLEGSSEEYESSEEESSEEILSSEEESNEDDSSEEEKELLKLLKRLEVQVNVKVQMNKFKKKHKVHHKRKKKHSV